MTPAGLLIPLLLLLLPFEPRHPLWAVAGVRFTVLEGAAALTVVACAIERRGHLLEAWRRRPAPLLALSAYAAAHLISAALAPHHRALSLRFALRMVAMAAFAWVVAALPAHLRRRGFLALAAASALVALLAIGEGLAPGALDPLVALFREGPVHVAGVRRATAGSEHPNLAAACLMYGLLAGVATGTRGGIPLAWAHAALTAAGLAFTYSRGAAAATVVALLALAVGQRARAIAAGGAALVVVGVLALFAVARGGWRPAPSYGVRYQTSEETMRLSPRERRPVTVRLTNTGTIAWDSLALSYHWLRQGARATEDGPPAPLPRTRPGETVAAEIELRAPAVAGAYVLVWDLRRADGTWLSREGVPPAAVDVAVGSASLVRASGVWPPRRAELWRLALRLWWQRPLIGVGPDNFRRLYGPAQGRAFWDDRLYANQTLLEAAATTGALGATALAATLVLVLRRSARARSGNGAAVFALAAGLTLHGLIDYVLAMTGHYLTLAWVVGAASAPDSESPR